MEELKRAMVELRDSARQLNEATDYANGIVKLVEDFLNKECSVGVYACVRVYERVIQDSGITIYKDLVYARVNGNYRIAVEHGTDEDPLDQVIKAWAECTRDEKLETVRKLPDLILAIAKKSNEVALEAKQAVFAVASQLSALTGKEAR